MASEEQKEETSGIKVRVAPPSFFFCMAVHIARDEKDVRLLLKNGFDANTRDSAGHTLLHFPKTTKAIKLLLEAGADVTARSDFQDTPLHVPMSAEAMQMMIDRGGDVNARNSFSATPLHYQLDPFVVEVLLNHGADVHVQNKRGETPLMAQRTKMAVQLLLDHGADPFVTNVHGDTVLYNRWLEADAIKLLLERGVSPHALNKSMCTPLQWLVSVIQPTRADFSSVVAVYVQAGAGCDRAIATFEKRMKEKEFGDKRWVRKVLAAFALSQ